MRNHGWSSRASDWNRLEAATAGWDWQTVPFADDAAVSVPRLPGVYLICAQPPLQTTQWYSDKELRTVLYVGRAKENLRIRFKHHLKRRDRLYRYRKLFFPHVHFVFHEERDLTENQIADVEDALEQTFCPPCNEIGVAQPKHVRGRLGRPERFALAS